jgi:hypothetical protein
VKYVVFWLAGKRGHGHADTDNADTDNADTDNADTDNAEKTSHNPFRLKIKNKYLKLVHNLCENLSWLHDSK